MRYRGFAVSLKVAPVRPLEGAQMHPTDKQELRPDSELPTDRAPEQSARAARAAAAAAAEPDLWCDSEAPTGVAVERPLLPRPPRAPQL